LKSVIIELNCPEHGLERFKIKVIKKNNISKNAIIPKFRTRPKYELQGVIIGKSVRSEEIKLFLMRYFSETGIMKNIVCVKFQI
jgi:hypothetical protein